MALVDDIKKILNEAATLDGSVVPANNPATQDPAVAVQVSGSTAPLTQAPEVVAEATTTQVGDVVVNPPVDDAEDQAVTEAIQALCSQKVDKAIFGKLLEGDFSDEFKDSVVTIFESTVNTRSKEIAAQIFTALEKNFIRHLNEEKLKFEGEKIKLNEAVVKYADAIAAEWLAENQIAIESALKVELNESFMTGLKDLLETHYIDIPQDKVDVIEALNKKVTKLTESLNEEIAKGVSLREDVQKGKKKAMIEENVKGLTVIAAEKVRSLCEATDFVSEEEFAKKIKVLKENFVTAPAPVKASVTKADPTVDAGKPIHTNAFDPMDRYVAHAVAQIKEMR